MTAIEPLFIRLYGQAMREDAEACNARLRENRDTVWSENPSGLSRTDMAILAAIQEADTPIRVQHAADIAGIERTNASHSAAKLRRMGYIEEAGRDPARLQVKLYKAVRMAQ
jgi:DNA-binding MarR family transcriptional regulator